MKAKTDSYREIMKATSIFGGVQIFQIIIAVVRSKFIAILLGPLGMGIAGLLTSTIGIVGNLTEFGLATSAVKDVAAANATGDKNRISVVVTVIRRWVWLTGFLGFAIAFIFAPSLSKIAFGNKDYTIDFLIIAITLLFTQISNGQSVLLRGTRQIQYLAKSNVIGAIVGLFISIPLYYFWHVNGIAPAILLTSISALLLSWYFSNKVRIPTVKVDRKTILSEGKGMLFLGFMLSLSGLITMGTSYIIRIYISKYGSVQQVGLYTAGFTIITTYVALVFTAMSTDYYPRLAEVAENRTKYNMEINHQAEIALLILAPILTIFIIYINWGIVLLYSQQFLAINSMVQWAAVGIFFKAASWSIAFLFLAKGASKVFFWNEVVANIYLLVLNLLGYYYGGLTGLGISFLIGYLFYLFQVFIVTRRLYNFRFYRSFYTIFFIQLGLAIICLLLVRLSSGTFVYIFGSIIIFCSFLFSYKELEKRIGIAAILQQQINKIKKIV